MIYSSLSVDELQNYGLMGDEKAIMELGRRALDWEVFDDYIPPCNKLEVVELPISKVVEIS